MSFKQWMTACKHWLLSEKGWALGMALVGALFIAAGIYRFHARHEPFGWVSLLGCVAGAFGAFFLLLITDYVLHHAPLVFIPWFVFLVYFAIIQPHLGVGMGLALWFIVVSQLRG